MLATGKIIPVSWLNQTLLISSILCVLCSMIIQEWAGLTSFPIYISISWAIFIIIMSVWISCFLFQFALKANSPFNIKFLDKWLYKILKRDFNIYDPKREDKYSDKSKNEDTTNKDMKVQVLNEVGMTKLTTKNKSLSEVKTEIHTLAKEIHSKYVDVWYKFISDDKLFPNEAQILLKRFLTKLFHKISLMDKVKLSHKLSNVFLLHFKEYHKALRRVERGTAPNIEEAFKYLHPGSRNMPALEHMLYRIVTILAQEFLQWELTSSLPCKLLLSVLAKRLLIFIETISSPTWLFQCLLDIMQPIQQQNSNVEYRKKQNKIKDKNIISNALEDGIVSATAAIISHPLLSQGPDSFSRTSADHKSTSLSSSDKKSSLCLQNLVTEHRGLWRQSISELESELDEDKISPIYEEPTDLASTIARLRTVLQQKSTVNTPLHAEEKSYVICEGSQFMNLSIPWTEFYTALDGSQQLLYCIQFDDVEQHGVDSFETTIATVRRQYCDFVHLHYSLKEIPELTHIMSNLTLPEGGRVELENYLRTLTMRLANECPTQLRHFLRPSNSVNKKADVVTPRFDKFLVKTVSGVFNSLRTVVPGFEIEPEEENVPLPTLMSLADIPWRFVEDIKSKSLASELQKLIAERTEYSSVDTAYEAVDSMEGTTDSALLSHWLETVSSYEEDVDELDSHLRLTCVAIDLVCELLAGIGSNNTLQQEAVVRWAKLLFGTVAESILQKETLRIFDHLGKRSLLHNAQDKKLAEETLTQLKERLVQELLVKIPNDLKLIFGEDDTLHIFKYLIGSYEVKKINMDLNLQMLDVLASQLLISCRLSFNKPTNV